MQKDGGNNRAYIYDVHADCDYLQVRHKFQTVQGGIPGWYFTAWGGTSGTIAYSPTTGSYLSNPECGIVSDNGTGYESTSC